jgi:hypothetical protein
MIECRHCREVISGPPDRYGARCPRCREPLYERAGGQWRQREEATEAGARCAIHPNNPSVGVCQRCGNFLCGVCRTRWLDRALCLACIERALESREVRPEDARAHRRQAVMALLFGVCAWLLLMLGGLPFLLSSHMSGLLVLSGLVALASLLPALFGVGQGAAAIRARGERMILATCGLILCGALVGLLLGGMLFSVRTASEGIG